MLKIIDKTFHYLKIIIIWFHNFDYINIIYKSIQAILKVINLTQYNNVTTLRLMLNIRSIFNIKSILNIILLAL